MPEFKSHIRATFEPTDTKLLTTPQHHDYSLNPQNYRLPYPKFSHTYCLLTIY